MRGEIIATMVLDAGKAAYEGDVEVTEAIDFANYYADSLRAPGFDDGSAFTPFGTVVVTPPWNFPFAIPCGGVLAALAAGNTVILKPASASAKDMLKHELRRSECGWPLRDLMRAQASQTTGNMRRCCFWW